MPTAIEVGDIVNVSLLGLRGRVLAVHEVLKLPSNNEDYWEFQAPNGGEIIAVPDPVTVAKVS